MRLWFTAPTIDCHFCGHATDLRKGKQTTRSFCCSACGSMNFLNPDGSLDDAHQQLYSNPNLPANLASLSKKASSATLPQQTAFTFCKDCQRNHQLQTHLLASYYGDEELSPEEEARLSAQLESYRFALDERYPMLCSDCAPGAGKLLRERDHRSRAVALNNKIVSASSPVKDSKMAQDPRASFSWKRDGLLWRVKGTLWAACQIGSLAIYAFG